MLDTKQCLTQIGVIFNLVKMRFLHSQQKFPMGAITYKAAMQTSKQNQQEETQSKWFHAYSLSRLKQISQAIK